MSDRVEWGVVGVGRRAREVMIPALLASAEAELVGVVGREERRREKEASEWPGVKVYPSLEAMLKEPGIHVIYIATPHFLHVPQAVQAIEAGKHVLIEPPLALSVDGAHKLIEKAKAQRVKVGVAFNYRFHPTMPVLREKIQSRAVGEIELLEASFSERVDLTGTWWTDSLRAGPAALLRLGVHALDLALWLTGESILEVTAAGNCQQERNLNTLCSLLFRFSGGGFGLILASTSFAQPECRLRIEGSTGRTVVEGTLSNSGPGRVSAAGPGGAEEHFEPANPVAHMVGAFSRAVASGADFHPDGLEGKKVVEVTTAAIEAMKAKKTVRVGEVGRVN